MMNADNTGGAYNYGFMDETQAQFPRTKAQGYYGSHAERGCPQPRNGMTQARQYQGPWQKNDYYNYQRSCPFPPRPPRDSMRSVEPGVFSPEVDYYYGSSQQAKAPSLALDATAGCYYDSTSIRRYGGRNIPPAAPAPAPAPAPAYTPSRREKQQGGGDVSLATWAAAGVAADGERSVCMSKAAERHLSPGPPGGSSCLPLRDWQSCNIALGRGINFYVTHAFAASLEDIRSELDNTTALKSFSGRFIVFAVTSHEWRRELLEMVELDPRVYSTVLVVAKHGELPSAVDRAAAFRQSSNQKEPVAGLVGRTIGIGTNVAILEVHDALSEQDCGYELQTVIKFWVPETAEEASMLRDQYINGKDFPFKPSKEAQTTRGSVMLASFGTTTSACSNGEAVLYTQDERDYKLATGIAKFVWYKGVQDSMGVVSRRMSEPMAGLDLIKFAGKDFPFHRMHVTLNQGVLPHVDPNDGGGITIIAWIHGEGDCSSFGTSCKNPGGGFVLYDYGLVLRPEKLTVMYLRSADVVHGSVAPDMPLPKGVGRLGMALCSNRQTLGRARNTLRDGGEFYFDMTCKQYNRQVKSKP